MSSTFLELMAPQVGQTAIHRALTSVFWATTVTERFSFVTVKSSRSRTIKDGVQFRGASNVAQGKDVRRFG